MLSFSYALKCDLYTFGILEYQWKIGKYFNIGRINSSCRDYCHQRFSQKKVSIASDS